MTAFETRSGLAALAVFAAIASAPALAAAETIGAFSSLAICDDASCGAAGVVSTGADDPAIAFPLAAASDPQAPIPSSQISTAGMVALGAVMMTSRARKRGLWALRAPWRSFAGRPV